MKKQIWLYLFIIFFLCCPVTGHAQEEVFESGWIGNPVYTHEEHYQAVRPDIRTFSVAEVHSSDEAAAYVNEQMLSREESFSLLYYTRNSDYKAELREIIDRAIDWRAEENPCSGDYLRFQIGGWKYTAGVKRLSNGEYRLSVNWTVQYYTTPSMEAQVDKELGVVIQKLKLDKKSDIEKIMTIYDYVCGNVRYEYANQDNAAYVQKYTAYDALTKGTAVCQGYAVLLYRMCREAGIDVRVIAGDSYQQPHTWNIVRIGKYWYNLDATWDANYYEQEYKSLLKCNADFPDHERRSAYLTAEFLSRYPMADRSYNVAETLQPVTFVVKSVPGGSNVTFQAGEEDAVIYYSAGTSRLTTQDICVRNGETRLFGNFYGTIYARAYKNGIWGKVSSLILKIPQVGKPVITQADGVVSIRTATGKSTIYYTTDGSAPSDKNGKRLENAGSFTVHSTCTVKTVAVREGFADSEITVAVAERKKIQPPSFAVKPVPGGQEVTFLTDESRGDIYYSFSGSSISKQDLHVTAGKSCLFSGYYGTLYARAYENGSWSQVSKLILRIPKVQKPTITVDGRGYATIRTATPASMLIYTTDGSAPATDNGKRVMSPYARVYVGRGKTVKAVAVRSGFGNSDIAVWNQP